MQFDEKKKSALVKPSILILFIAAAIYLVRFSPAQKHLTIEKLGLFLDAAGVWAPLMYVFVYTAGVCLFLPGTLLTALDDAVLCAKAGQQTPQGYYNIERMLKPIVRRSAVILCGTCMDARGMKDDEVVEGARRGTMSELTDLTVRAERVIVF